MHLRPWQPLPGVRRYLCLWAQNSWRDLLLFGWHQLVIGLVIGVLTILLTILLTHRHPLWQDLLLGTIPTLAIFFLVGLLAAIRAPIKIHNRQLKLIRKSNALRNQRTSTLAASLRAADSQIIGLQNDLAAKGAGTQAEGHHYNVTKEQISNLSEDAKILFRHLWSHEKVFAGLGLSVPGLDNRQIMYLFQCLENTQMVRKREEAGHGSYTIWWEIVPGYKTALGELLYSESSSPTSQT